MYYDSQIRKRDEKLKGQNRGEKIIIYRNAMMNISTNNGKKRSKQKNYKFLVLILTLIL